MTIQNLLVLLLLPYLITTQLTNCPVQPCIRSWYPAVRPVASQIPVTVQFWFIKYCSGGWFDVISQYTPTQSGPFTKGDLSLRRPISEHNNDTLKNIAIIQFTYRIHLFMFPESKTTWDSLVISHGLPLDTTTVNPNNPIGMGNLIWDIVFDKMNNDGFNSLGDNDGKITYNRIPFSDTTGYYAINPPMPANALFPDAWQPNLVAISSTCIKGGNKFFPRVQTFITPQAAEVTPMFISGNDLDNLDWQPPQESWLLYRAKYKTKVDDVITNSANLNDQKKMIAEFFDQKLFSLGVIGGALFDMHYGNHPDRVVKYFQFEIAVNGAVGDAIRAIWKAKRTFNIARPFTAIRVVYGKTLLKPADNITAYAGPFQGVRNFPADQWQSYLTTDAHPEYPSGTACVCAIWGAVAKRFFGNNDTLNFSFTFPAGSSVIEPGLTPVAPVTVFWPTITDMVNDCGQSRLWAGVHFQSSINEAKRICPMIADEVITKVNRAINNGDVSWSQF